MPNEDEVDVLDVDEELVIDFEKADTPPSGELELMPVKAIPGVSQNHNRKITLHLKVTGADDPDMIGRMVFNDLTFTQAAAFRVTQAAKAYGILSLLPKPMVVNKENVEAVAAAFMSGVDPVWCLVEVQKGVGEYEGQDRANVKRYGIRH
jgi:hypothetical protein